MKYDVDLHVTADCAVVIEAESEAEARKIAMGLQVEVDLVFPPESVDDSNWDRGTEHTVTGVSEALEGE